MVNCKSLSGIEGSTMAKMVSHAARMLQQPGWLSHLGGRNSCGIKAYPELQEALDVDSASIAKNMHWRGMHIASKDLIFFDSKRKHMVQVVACLQVAERYGLVVRTCRMLESGECSSIWEISSDPSIYVLTHEYIISISFSRIISTDRVEVLH
jgi:hypothetical protein